MQNSMYFTVVITEAIKSDCSPNLYQKMCDEATGITFPSNSFSRTLYVMSAIIGSYLGGPNFEGIVMIVL